MSDNYDNAYRQADWFGPDMAPLLRDHAGLIPAEALVLDIGVGQGRNALPLARRGCRVVGIDTSEVAVATTRSLAATEGLENFTAVRESFLAHGPEVPYDVVLCFGLLQMLPADGVSALTERLRDWVAPDGLLFVTAWRTDDPSFVAMPACWRPTGPRSFHDPDGDRNRFFLHEEEILDFFPAWRVLHHQEGLGPVHRHGDGPEERHGQVEALFQKPNKPLIDAWTRLSG